MPSFETAVHDTLHAETDFNWTTRQTPAQLIFNGGQWRLTIDARNPKKDNTWTITLVDIQGEEYKLGPVQTGGVADEVEALVRKHIAE